MSTGFRLNPQKGYFQLHGVNVMAFDDFYPEGHQSGVSILMHAARVATNGDVRFEQTPGQWQPVPKQLSRVLDEANNAIITRLAFPDRSRHLTGFNPMLYPDLDLTYTVTVKGEGGSVRVTVDLDQPVPPEYAGKLCFNMELFPADLFGKLWLMDDRQGYFPRQPNGPVMEMPSNYEKTASTQGGDGLKVSRERLSGDHTTYNPIIADDLIAAPYAQGRRFTVRPDDPLHRFAVESRVTDLKLYDGRMNHNNGWFAISCDLPLDTTQKAVEWVITPSVDEGWMYPPVVQVSQVGYLPDMPKRAIVELDQRDMTALPATLEQLTETGWQPVRQLEGKVWGHFLRYRYLIFDFTDTPEGMYRVAYGASASAPFRIAADAYDRGVWQPVLEYFLPVQMCHMRVQEKYRVWHDLCHNDDARMAPVHYNHIDGYWQGDSTLCKYQPGDCVPGLNQGGWHDAGDYDLRVESQAGEMYILTNAYEAFGVNYDATMIDQQSKLVEIHQPDGKNDILQQIEHGALSVLGAYKALGRLYRGIIANDLRQYVLLGDPASMTANIKGDADDRWVFTEDNPPRELNTASQLAASARALKGFNDELSADALKAASELYAVTRVEDDEARMAKIRAAAELLITTGDKLYKQHLLSEADFISSNIQKLGWIIAKALPAIADDAFAAQLEPAFIRLQKGYEELSAETPYGIPYRPHIWGAGWDIQRLGAEYYYLHRAMPELFKPDLMFNALHFVLGCHPGVNSMSFASGVGADSALQAYGINRADFSYTPGGVISGTALIRPDFPELLKWPFLWQQTEYVLGGGSSHYMFLVLAARQVAGGK